MTPKEELQILCDVVNSIQRRNDEAIKKWLPMFLHEVVDKEGKKFHTTGTYHRTNSVTDGLPKYRYQSQVVSMLIYFKQAIDLGEVLVHGFFPDDIQRYKYLCSFREYDKFKLSR